MRYDPAALAKLAAGDVGPQVAALLVRNNNNASWCENMCDLLMELSSQSTVRCDLWSPRAHTGR